MFSSLAVFLLLCKPGLYSCTKICEDFLKQFSNVPKSLAAVDQREISPGGMLQAVAQPIIIILTIVPDNHRAERRRECVDENNLAFWQRPRALSTEATPSLIPLVTVLLGHAAAETI